MHAFDTRGCETETVGVISFALSHAHESMGQSSDRVTSSATVHALGTRGVCLPRRVHTLHPAADVHSSYALLPRGWGPADMTMNRGQV